jgi:hypothetical protein
MRGAAALAVAMVLLFVMTLIVFFVNRGLLFEQRTSANQFRSTRAFEVAEAGIEWATALLNDPRKIDGACVPAPGQPESFRSLYVPASASPVDLTPPADARAGCRIATGSFACSCPAPGTAPNLGTSTDPSFTVEFADEPADPGAVRLTAYGCINQSAACGPGATAGGDATATVHVTLKLRPILRAAPPAPLTTGGWTQICGAFNITNQSQAVNGYLVNSGGQIQIGTGTYQSGALPVGAPTCSGGGTQTLVTIPGTPLANAMVAGDPTLSSLAASSNDMFATFFGTTLAQYRSAPTTFYVTGGTPGDRASALIDAYNQNFRSFWIDGDIDFSSGTSLGSATEPVTLVATAPMTFSGNFDIYGLLYSDSANWNDLGTGTSTVHGAVISRVNYRNNGNGSIVYDPAVLGRVRDMGVLVRVPGSWRDIP